jgi:hypothetical protein
MTILIRNLTMGTTFLGPSRKEIQYSRFLLKAEDFGIFMTNTIDDVPRFTEIVPKTTLSLDLAVALDNGDHHAPEAYLILKSPVITLTIDTADMMGFLSLVGGNFGRPVPTVDGKLLEKFLSLLSTFPILLPFSVPLPSRLLVICLTLVDELLQVMELIGKKKTKKYKPFCLADVVLDVALLSIRLHEEPSLCVEMGTPAVALPTYVLNPGFGEFLIVN